MNLPQNQQLLHQRQNQQLSPHLNPAHKAQQLHHRL